MASLASLSQSPTGAVPVGGSVTVTVAYSTDPGGNFTITVYKDGASQGQTVAGSFVAETVPSTSVGSTNVGWEIRTSLGVLRSTATQNQFTLSKS